jgi:hypothetical protein
MTDDIAYLAALVDGEGSIGLCLTSRKKGKYPCVLYRLTVWNSDVGIVKKAERILSEILKRVVVGHLYKPTNSKKPAYAVDVRSKEDLVVVLPLIMPHLASEEKMAKAGFVLRWLDGASLTNDLGRTTITDYYSRWGRKNPAQVMGW